MPAQSDQVTVWAKPPSGVWSVIGREILPGVQVENVELTANDWGSDKATFDLKRRANRFYPDLLPWTEINIDVGGQRVWAGRIKETPARWGQETVINVQAEGWQYHLDDALFEPVYVHSNLGNYQDTRGIVDVSITQMGSAAQVTVDHGISTIFPKGSTVRHQLWAGVTLDFGPTSRVKRFGVNIEWWNAAGYIFYLRGHDDTSSSYFGAGNQDLAAAANPTSNVYGGDFTNPKRFVSLMMFPNPGADFVSTQDSGYKIVSALASTVSGYVNLSPFQSLLKSETVLTSLLGSTLPKLSTSTAKIASTSFIIPEFAQFEFRTPRETAMAMNAFHNYVLKVDVDRVLNFQPRPTVAKFEVGEWAPFEFEDTSLNSGDDIYNQVIVEGTGPDGRRVSVTNNNTALQAAMGFTRAKALPVEAALTSGVATQLSGTYLQAHGTIPFKGTLVVKGTRAVRQAVSGANTNPALLLTQTGERIRLTNLIDPASFGIGREGIISTVTYVHSERKATIEIDNGRRNFDAYLARLNLVMGQVR